MASTLGLPKKDRDFSRPDSGPLPPLPVAPDLPPVTAVFDPVEVRLRCLEAAAQPALVAPHEKGYAAGILAAAQQFEAWVLGKVEKAL